MKVLETEVISCDFCGGSDDRLIIVRPDGLSVKECKNCGLAFLNPRPKSSQIVELYSKDYFQKSEESDSIFGYEDYYSEFNLRFLDQLTKKRFDLAREYFDPRGKNILEIGCATGDFCDLISKNGAKAKGLDLSGDAIEIATSKHRGIDFVRGDIKDLPTPEKYDAIFAFEVIEHVESPKRFIGDVMNRLNPGGYFFLSTPNYECAKEIGTGNWVGFHSSFEHLYFFSNNSLQNYFRSAGMKIVEVFTGLGTGAVNHRHQKLKKILLRGGKLGRWILSELKAAKQRLSQPSVDYSKNDGFLNNLFMVMKS